MSFYCVRVAGVKRRTASLVLRCALAETGTDMHMNMSVSTNLSPQIAPSSLTQTADRPSVSVEAGSGGVPTDPVADGPAAVFTPSTDAPSAGTYGAAGTLSAPSHESAAKPAGSGGMQHGSGCSGG